MASHRLSEAVADAAAAACKLVAPFSGAESQLTAALCAAPIGSRGAPESSQKWSAAHRMSRRYVRPLRDSFGRVGECQEGRYEAERTLRQHTRVLEAVGRTLAILGLKLPMAP